MFSKVLIAVLIATTKLVSTRPVLNWTFLQDDSRMARLYQLGIFDVGHAKLADAAASAGIVYKPCGAGGGDLGIVIASAASDVAAFIDTARHHNFKQLSMAIDETGLIRGTSGERIPH